MIALLTWLATYGIHSSLLLVAVALLTAFLVRREAWRETLWKVALVGGLLTTLLQLSMGVRPLVGQWEVPAPAGSPGAAASGRLYRAPDPVPHGPSGPPDARALEPGIGWTPAARHSGRSTPPAWPTVLVGAWAVVAAWKMARVLHRHIRVRRLLRDRTEVADPLALSMLNQARRQAGVWRMVRLTSTPRASTPFTFGTSEICLPEGLFDRLSVDERRCVIAHELAHLVRRDPQWQFVTAVIESVFFFQPMNRLAGRRIRESAEYLADDWAVRQTRSAIGLARSLATVANWHAADGREMPRPIMALAEGGSPLLKRVERLLAGAPAPPPPGAGARLLVTAVLLATTFGAAPGITTRAMARDPDVGPAGTERADVRVLDSADRDRPLAARFASAMREIIRGGGRDAWIAYESRSSLPPGRKHETDSGADRERSGPGGIVLHSTRDRTWNAGAPDLVVLLRVHADPGGTFSVARVVGGTPSLAIDPGSLPVYWLFAVEDSESIGLLASLGTDAAEMQVRETLIHVIGVHHDSTIVVPWLSQVLAGDNARSIRASAVMGLSWHPSPEVIELLRAVALGDRSKAVRRKAAEALGKTGATTAVAALVDIVAAAGAPVGTRKEAVEAIGTFRQPKILPVLTGIAFSADDHNEVQREAVEAVAEMGVPESVPLLERIAVEHPVPAVRGEAVDELAEAGRRADLEVLFRIAMEDPDQRIQRAAAEKIADFRLKDAAPFLERIAWEHASAVIRREAVRPISALPESLGLPILEKIAAAHPDTDLRQEAATAIERYAGERESRQER